jgi:sigma-B regulation protein RsbQ
VATAEVRGYGAGVNLTERHNVTSAGVPDGQPIVFAHGFGCDQQMWRYVAPRFEATHRVVLFDHAGAGGASPEAYDPERHASLDGYADDVVALLDGMDLHDVVLVGHSVSAMIAVLAARRRPERLASLVLVAPSPRFVDDPATGYVGGFSAEDVEELLDALDGNYLGWSSAMAPVVVGNPDRPELGEELTASFCRTDPEVARRFARATFLSDHRGDLPHVGVPALVLQCSDDALAPVEVGRYVADHLPDARLVVLEATGHCPNLSAPEETAAAIAAHLGA